jgi:Ca-activated chloride channel family protein
MKKFFVPTELMTNQSNRLGAMLVLMTSLLVVMLIMVSFTVDVAWMELAKTELRAASDAAAKAGTEALSRTQNQQKAIEAAIHVASQNKVAGRSLVLRSNDIEIGNSTMNPDGSWSFQNGKTPFTSVRVMPKLDGTSGNPPVGLFFGKLVGTEIFTPKEIATAAQFEQDIVLCLDRSHSMCFDRSGNDWDYPPLVASRILVKNLRSDSDKHLASSPHPALSRWSSLSNAISTFMQTLKQLETTPQIGLVTWGSQITSSNYEGNLTKRTFAAVTRNRELTTDYTKITGDVTSLGNDIMLGGTNMSSGLTEAIAVLTAKNIRPMTQKVIILMSDGQWNQGGDPLTTAQTAKNSGIIIHTISFLEGTDQGTMKQIATLTGGTHYFASSEDELKEAFRRLALSLPVVLIE